MQASKACIENKSDIDALYIERDQSFRRLDENYTRFEQQMESQITFIKEDHTQIAQLKDQLGIIDLECETFKRSEDQAMKAERLKVQSIQNKSLQLMGVLRDEAMTSGSLSQRAVISSESLSVVRSQSKLKRWK